MKVITDSTSLKRLLNTQCPKGMPVKLAASGSVLGVTFSRGENTFVEKKEDAHVIEEGYVVLVGVQLKKLQKWAAAQKAGTDLVIESRVSGEQISLDARVSGDTKGCSLICEVPTFEGWPKYSPEKELGYISVDKLYKMLDRARPGCNASDGKYYSIVAVQLSPTGITLSWTDGCILFSEQDKFMPALSNELVLVPTEAFIQLARHAAKNSEIIAVSRTGIRTDGVAIMFDKPDFKYPDLAAISSPQGDIIIRVDADAFKSGIKQVSSCLRNWLILRTKENKLNLLAYDDGGKEKAWTDCPRAETWIDADTKGAGDQRVGFGIAFCVDCQYLKVILAKAEGIVSIQCQDNDSPLYINIQNSDIKTVLMPVETDFLYESV